MIDQLIAVSLPFTLSIVTQILGAGVKGYAQRAAKASTQTGFSFSSNVQEFGVNLAVQTYSHLSFVFSVLMSSISCIAYTILSPRPTLAAVGATALVLLLPWWIVRWQGLSAIELQGSKGRPMKIAAWVTILVLWAITLYAKFFSLGAD